MTQDQQKKYFHEDIINLYKIIRKELKYTPPQLLEMINKYGGYEAAIKFIATDANTFVFSLLWEKERLDLSIEALIVNEKHRMLFLKEIVDYCDKRLKEYNYAPKKIEPQNPGIDAFLDDLIDEEMMTHLINTEKRQNYKQYDNHECYFDNIEITLQQWKDILKNEKIFSPKNQDMIIRMYLMGGNEITSDLLSEEEGYSSNYPYKEVMIALGKRIKVNLKIEMPTDKNKNPIPWNILFTGWFESNRDFSWSIKDTLMQAIQELITEGEISTEEINVKNVVALPQEDIQTIKEEEIFAEENHEQPISLSIEQIEKVCLEYYGAVCDLCGFDFGYTYGEAFESLITVYPIKNGYVQPREMMENMPCIDPHKDLIPLCANCHKVLTSSTDKLTVEMLKNIIK